MKGILEFDLNERCEEKAHRRAINATNAYIALHEMMSKLRSIAKYEELTEKEHAIVERIRSDFYSILENNSLNLEDLD